MDRAALSEPRGTQGSAIGNDGMEYATFSKRLGALVVDSLLLSPLTVATIWSGGVSKCVAIAVMPICSALGIGYHVYLHGRFGQTVGKRLSHIRVVRTDASRISWREAWLRSAVDVVLAVVIISGGITVMLGLPEAHFAQS